MVTIYGGKSEDCEFNPNDIVVDGLITYICMENSLGQWMIKKIDTTSGTTFRYASVVNNSSITSYLSAYTNMASLDYGYYSEVF